MPSYTRRIEFTRVGLHHVVPSLTATVQLGYGTAGQTVVQSLSLGEQIAAHVRPYLAHHGDLMVEVHPDEPTGRVLTDDEDGRVLAEFTVHLGVNPTGPVKRAPMVLNPKRAPGTPAS